jgi:hypothetical protein
METTSADGTVASYPPVALVGRRTIQTAGLIGDPYVSMDPGGSEELLKPGDTITGTEPPVDLGKLIGKYAFGDVRKSED